MDLGVYGIPRQVVKNQPFDSIDSARKCEDFMTKHRGAPFLYANTFYTRTEFEEAFNVGKGSLYDKVRERTKASDAFPHLFDKVSYRESWMTLKSKEKSFWQQVAYERGTVQSLK